MNWILIAFLEPVLHALANVLDSNLTNRIFKSAWALTVFIAVCDLLFLPIIWLMDTPTIPAINLWPFFFLVAAIELFYSYPYYKALQNDDTSVAVSMFSLGKIFVPILAFLLIGESLRPIQYGGFILVTLSSAALTFNPKTGLRMNKSFFYMLLSSSLLAVEVVVYKYIFNQVSWGTGFVWTMGVSALIGLASIALPDIKKSVVADLPKLKKYYHFILLVSIVGFIGNIGFSYAISQVPATVSRSIGAFQPFFVLLYAIIFARFFPLAFKEKITLSSIIKKVVLFILISIGVVLTVN